MQPQAHTHRNEAIDSARQIAKACGKATVWFVRAGRYLVTQYEKDDEKCAGALVIVTATGTEIDSLEYAGARHG